MVDLPSTTSSKARLDGDVNDVVKPDPYSISTKKFSLLAIVYSASSCK
jgi:hypothetical protein